MIDVNINENSYRMIIAILKTISRIDRLRLLCALYSGRYVVGELTKMIHGDMSYNHSCQTSAALAPMRRLGLIDRTRQGKFNSYRLTDLGRKVLDTITTIKTYTGDDDVDEKLKNVEIYAWIGEDENGVIGLKQALIPTGLIPVVSTSYEGITQPTIIQQMTLLAHKTRLNVRLCRFTISEVLITLKPDAS